MIFVGLNAIVICGSRGQVCQTYAYNFTWITAKPVFSKRERERESEKGPNA